MATCSTDSFQSAGSRLALGVSVNHGIKMIMSKRWWAILILTLIAVAALAFAARVIVPSLYFAYTIHRQIGEIRQNATAARREDFVDTLRANQSAVDVTPC